MKIFNKLVFLLPIATLASCNNNSSQNKNVYLYYGENIVVKESVKVGDEYTAPDGIKTEAYTFGGWYLNPAFSAIMKAKFPIKIVDDVHLYANYDIKRFVVTFYINHAEAFLDTLTTIVNWGQKVTYFNPTTYNPGYEFKGWYTTKEGTQGTAWDFDKPVKNELDLYAKWGDPI